MSVRSWLYRTNSRFQTHFNTYMGGDINNLLVHYVGEMKVAYWTRTLDRLRSEFRMFADYYRHTDRERA